MSRVSGPDNRAPGRADFAILWQRYSCPARANPFACRRTPILRASYKGWVLARNILCNCYLVMHTGCYSAPYNGADLPAKFHLTSPHNPVTICRVTGSTWGAARALCFPCFNDQLWLEMHSVCYATI